MSVALRSCPGADLDAATLYELLTLRVEVFVVEQQCPYPELDGRDLLRTTRHFWLCDDGSAVISTLRLMAEPEEDGVVFRIGRVCTAKTERGRGHATALMRAALAEVGQHRCRLSAQTYLVSMYARHGFIPDGAEFVEDGIPHIPMVRVSRP